MNYVRANPSNIAGTLESYKSWYSTKTVNEVEVEVFTPAGSVIEYDTVEGVAALNELITWLGT
jgi:hypothetical protein